MTGVVKSMRVQAVDGVAAGAGVDGVSFREAMSRVGAAVHIVTTAGPLGRGGATMTAVTSVTDAPPTLLVCVNRTGRLATILRGNGIFCVNTLVEGDEALAGVFAGRGGLDHEARFGHGRWTTAETGAPVLVGARAALDCRVVDIHDVGSHAVVFGRVEAVRLGEAHPALLYVDRGYRILPSVADA